MSWNDNAAMNELLRNRGRIVEPTVDPDAESPPEPVRYAAGSGDGGKIGTPLPADPHKAMNGAFRIAADRVKGRL